jgi:hypothetical protein
VVGSYVPFCYGVYGRQLYAFLVGFGGRQLCAFQVGVWWSAVMCPCDTELAVHSYVPFW